MTDGRPRVIYIGAFKLPDKNAAALRVRFIAHLLVALGYRVLLVGVTNRQISGIDSCQESCIGEHVECYETQYPQTFVTWLHRVFGVPKIHNLVAENAFTSEDIIITYNYPAIAHLRILSQFKKEKVRVIADCTEWYDYSVPVTIRQMLVIIDTFLRMHIAVFRSNGVIAVSNYLEKWCKKKEKLPVVFIPTVVPKKIKSSNSWNPLIVKKLVFIVGDCGTFGTRWRESMWKDRLDWFLDVLSLLPNEIDYQLQVFGLEKQRFIEIAPRHEDFLQQSGEKVSFEGICSNQKVCEATSEASYSIIVRHDTRRMRAGFPTKIAESVSLGTPVITNLMYLGHKSLLRCPEILPINITGGNYLVAKNQMVDYMLKTPEEERKIRSTVGKSTLFDESEYFSSLRNMLEYAKR